MKSIKSQIILVVITFTIIICGTLGFVSYQIAKNAVTYQIHEALEELTATASDLVNSKIENQLAYLETVAIHGFVSSDTAVPQKTGFLNMAAGRMNFSSLAITDLKGNAIRSDGSEVNIAEREYFQKAVQGISNVSDVIVSESTGETIVAYAVPINTDGKITGVLYGVRDASEVTNMIQDISYGGHGYVFVISNNGTMLAHPNLDLVYNMVNYIEESKENKDFQGLGSLMESRMIQGETGIGQYYYEGLSKIAGFAPIPGTDWSLAVSAGLDEIHHDVDYLGLLIMVITIGLILIGIIAAFVLSGFITKPIAHLTTVLERFSNYDLTVDEDNGHLKYLNNKNELGKIANALVKMRDAFANLLKQAVTSAEMVGSTSEELSASILEISNNTQNQASTTEELSSTMEAMTAGIQVVNQNMNLAASDVDIIQHTMSEVEKSVIENSQNLQDINYSIEKILSALDVTRASINTITDKSRVASNEADDTVIMAKVGKENLDKTVNQMNSIQNTILNLSEVIDGLGESANQIGDITNLIKDVAEQTNLLALNASIEAARAGEHGKGFAVVAQAIGDLAEESQNATKEITKVIKNIQLEIGNAVENSKEGTRVVEDGTQLIQETNGSLDKMFSAIQMASDVIRGITSQMDVQSKDTNEVYSAASDINDKVSNLMAAMEEETASATEITNSLISINQVINDIKVSLEQQSVASEEVSSAVNDNAAGIEQISSGNAEIARSSEELAKNAQELVEQVQRFKI